MFPKARIQRFNEVPSCAPAPGSYDPKYDVKIKGVVLEKSERFVESKQDGNLIRSSSLNALAVFRTPQMPRKVTKKTSSTVKSSKHDAFNANKICKNMDKEFDSTDDESTSSNCELFSLREHLSQATKDLAESSMRCTQLEEELSQSKALIANLEDIKKNLTEKIDLTNQELASTSSKCDTLTEQYNLLEANLAERKAAVSELEETRTEMQLEMAILKERAGKNVIEIEQAVKQKLDLENELSEMKKKNKESEDIREALSQEVAEIKDRLGAVEVQVQVRDEHCQSLEITKREMMLQLEEKLQTMEYMTFQIEEFQENISLLTQRLDESAAEIERLLGINSAMEEQVTLLENKLQDATVEIEMLLSRCEIYEEENKAKEEKLKSVNEEKLSLQNEIQDLLTKLKSLQAELIIAEKALENANFEIADEREQRSKLEKEFQEVSLYCVELHQKLEQRQSLILNLQSDLSATSCELEERRAEIEQQAKKFKTEIEQICVNHNQELSQTRTNFEKNIAEIETRAAKTQAKQEYKLSNLRELARKLSEKVTEEREVTNQLQIQLDNERQDHSVRIEELNADVKVAMENCNRLDKALADTQVNLESVHSQCQNLDRLLLHKADEYAKDLEEVQAKLQLSEEALKEEKEKAQKQIDQLTKECADRVAQIEQNTRKALEEAENKLQQAEIAYSETLKQVGNETQDLLKATKAEALEELEKMKAISEKRVYEAEEEVAVIASQLHEAKEELKQVNAAKEDLIASDLEKQAAIVKLEDRVCSMELELSSSQNVLANAQDNLKAVTIELNMLKKIRRNLEIIGHETLNTVNAVSRRLLDSEDEILRLSSVNSELEVALDYQKESLSALEAQNLKEIGDVRAELLNKVEEYKNRYASENLLLQEQIYVLKESVEMYAARLEVANKNVEDLEKDREERINEIADLEHKINELQAMQDFLANQLQDYLSIKTSCQELQSELDSCKTELEKACADAADGEVEIQHREKQIAELTKCIEDLDERIIELQGTVMDLDSTVEERDQEINQLKYTVDQLQDCSQKSNLQISELTQDVEKSNYRIKELVSELDNQKTQSSEQVNALILAKNDLQCQLESMNTVVECHKMNVAKAAERIETLVNVVAAKESEIEKLMVDMDELRSNIQSTNLRIEELKALCEKKDEELHSAQEEIENLQNGVKTNEECITNLKYEIDFQVAFRKECELKITEMLQDKVATELLLEDTKEKVHEMMSVITDKDVFISHLERKIRDFSEKIDLLKKEAETGLAQITEAEKAIVILQADKITQEDKILYLNQEVEQKTAIVQQQNMQIESLNQNLVSQIAFVEDLKKNLDVSHNKIENLQSEKSTLQDEINVLKMESECNLQEAKNETDEANGKYEKEKEKLETLEKMYRDLETENINDKSIFQKRETELCDAIASLKLSIGEKTQEVGAITGKVQQLESVLDQYSQDNKEALQKVKTLEGELKETVHRKETYKAAVLELQQAIKQSRARMASLEEDLRKADSSVKLEQERHRREIEEVKESASKASEWEERYYELEALVGPFRSQLEAYETERQALESRKEEAEHTVRSLAQKYAEVLGHQNHKQKIHHVINLKEQIFNLKKENERLDAQNRAQKRTIEKLKEEHTRNSSFRCNSSLAFKNHEDSLHGRMSLAPSKADNRLKATGVKNKENISDLSTPLSARTSTKVKEELVKVSPVRQSPGPVPGPVRNSPAGAASPMTPLKEVQNQQN